MTQHNWNSIKKISQKIVVCGTFHIWNSKNKLWSYFLCSDPPSWLGDAVYRCQSRLLESGRTFSWLLNGNGVILGDGRGGRGSRDDGHGHGCLGSNEDGHDDTRMPGWVVLIINIINTIKLKNVLVLVLQLVYCVMFYKACYNKEQTWFRSCSYMNGMLKNILLLRQCVESNPGPVMHRSNVSVRTYNCNGLGVVDKCFHHQTHKTFT